jgi:predicted RNA-binding protein with PIN domain
MLYLVDGHNVLGALRLTREGAEAKRHLLKLVSSWARRSRSKAIVFFDGSLPDAFATHLGSVTARFSAPRPADDLIVAEVAKIDQPCVVVTSDRALADRVKNRRVKVSAALEFARELMREEGESRSQETDWEAYFADEKNREN